MDWSDVHLRFSLLRLREEGQLRVSLRTQALVDHLLSVGWVGLTTRRTFVRKVPGCDEKITELLTRVWPEWAESLSALRIEGLPLTPEELRKLRRKTAVSKLESLPPRLHRKTWAAAVAQHSKSTSPTDEDARCAGVQLTSDSVLRLRANRGLRIRSNGGVIVCDALMDAAGEVILPERAFLEGPQLEGGLPRAVMTVENLGAFVDLPAAPGLLVVYAPGWDLTLTLLLSRGAPASIPWYHFGDLDPNGIGIYCRLREALAGRCQLFLPSYWESYVQSHGLPQESGISWPDYELPECVRLIHVLNQQRKWLEQEVLVVDPRLKEELYRLLDDLEP